MKHWKKLNDRGSALSTLRSAHLPRSKRARLEAGLFDPLPNGLVDDVNDSAA